VEVPEVGIHVANYMLVEVPDVVAIQEDSQVVADWAFASFQFVVSTERHTSVDH